MREEVLDRFTAYQLAELQVLEQIDPWGERRADLRMAVLAYQFACVHAGKDRKPKFKDFLLESWFREHEQSDEEIVAILQQAAAVRRD